MNPLNVFFHPGKTAKHFLVHPALGISVFLTLLPTLVFAFATVALGLRIPASTATDAGKGIVYWVASAAVLYLLLYALKGKASEGKFTGLLSALALTRLLTAAAVLGMFVFALVLAPGAFPEFRKLQSMAAPSMQDLRQVMDRVPIHTDFVSLGLALALVLFMALMVLLSAYIWFEVIAAAKESSTLKNLLVLALALAIVGMFPVVF